MELSPIQTLSPRSQMMLLRTSTSLLPGSLEDAQARPAPNVAKLPASVQWFKVT